MMLMLDICVAIYWRNIWLISHSIFVQEVFKVNIHVFYFFGQVLSATLDKRIILSHADGEIINWKLTHYYGRGPFKSHESSKQLDPRVNHTELTDTAKDSTWKGVAASCRGRGRGRGKAHGWAGF